ncbi:MAG TPA: serine hydrolase [Chthonomonadaceae bacterium]|nr:serine hydrolase [Chthonomonadaceae bacterium]
MTTEWASLGLEDLDAFILETMEIWKVPGLAVAIVRDGQVVHARGYGWRDLKDRRPVTPATLFAIGSITKSFTVGTLAALAQQGKLDWDTPVREYLPDFRLHDPVATERMTPRDLVTHRSGLPRHDGVWYNAPLSREELYHRLRYLEPSRDFRSAYQYNNLMYMTAGYLAERLSGRSWEECVRQMLFTPLGMNRANFSVNDSQRTEDYALPYQLDEAEEAREIAFRVIDAVGPAGSINASIEDMIPYLRLHLNGGKHEETQVLAERDVKEMQSPQMPIPDSLPFPELGHVQYGMGLAIGSYRGHKRVSHGGGIDGFTAEFTFMPQDRIGMVLLSNMYGSSLPAALALSLYDRLLGLEPIPWSARFKEMEAKGKAAEEAAKAQGLTPRKPGTQPAHPLAAYAGEYEHPAYGTVTITPDGDALTISHHGFTSPLRHFHYEVFETPPDKLNRLERLKFQFHTDLDGEVGSLSVPFEPNVKEIVFSRVADRSMRERAFLEPFAGEYEIGGITIAVALQGDGTLLLIGPGQPPRELMPVRGTKFDVQGLSGFSVEFQKDPAGAVTGVALYQPNGNYLATKR